MKILIAQNENYIANSIHAALSSFGYTPLDPVINYNDAIQSIEKHRPDFSILDVKLEGEKTGIELAHTVNKLYQIPFIFLTSKVDRDTINTAKLTNPFAFLIKPFDLDELYASIELAHYQNSQRQYSYNLGIKSITVDSLFIKQKGGYIKLKFADILYIKSDGVYLDVITLNGKTYIIRSTIDAFINKLNSNFLKVHRSYVINTKHIDKVVDFEYIQINERHIPIGRKHKQQFMELMNLK